QKNAGQEQRSGISRLWKNDPVTREAMVSCHLLAPKRKESGVAVSRGITRTRNDSTRKGPQAESITARAMTGRFCWPGNRSNTSIRAIRRPVAGKRNARFDITERLHHRPARNKCVRPTSSEPTV